jgi:protein TonB
MVAYSLLAHGVLVGALSFMPTGLLTSSDDTDRIVMTVTMGGPTGPRSGGMTPMGGRPIQEVAPPTARPEPARAPAPRTPEMTAPVVNAKPAPRPKPAPAKPAPSEARSRTPTKGPETRAGTTVTETGVQGTGFGLSTGGGGTGGYLDVGNFCCPEYLSTMIQLIHRNWNSRQGISADAMVKYTIQRNGQITDVTLEKSSGYTALDLTAQRALLVTRQLPPLPAAFTEATLTVHLRFEYQP